ncbi:cytochrome P450 [Saccharomonospora amisosensis]|uniref:Cytochrome P450 n=2 Tax=Saccharomonospora TaxID=1851 RepID=H5X552_9PSEU|nr:MULTISPECIES: cytochrome P450 [Saccharomonospora]EHR53384.1 cytochrome P450 [Saccharomonospora marina XMU15]NIJ09872.1 cytochrome P450 [Saccharomonospora amisosensis]
MTSTHQEVATLYGPRFQNNPAELYRQMREKYGPVAPVLLEGDVPGWLVLGYREVYYVTSNPHLFARTSRGWHGWKHVSPDWSLRPYVEYQPSSILTDAEEHQRLAPALHGALAEVDQVELRSHVQRLADQLIDRFAGKGEADLVSEYTHQLPLLVLAKLFGLPDAEAPVLVRDVAASADEGDEAVRAHQRIVERMRALVREKRERPGGDLPSRILEHPMALSDDEIATDLFLTMGAGQLTTADWMGNALRLMLTDDRFAVNLSGGRRSVGQALNEVLWEETPTQNFIGRFATRDTHLGGHHIQTGDLLVLGLAAANTDPHVRPESYDNAVGNQAYMSFSHGEHGCPYPAQEIAATIVEGGIEVVLDRLPDVHLSVPGEQLEWRQSVWMRGLIALPVEFTPTHTSTTGW